MDLLQKLVSNHFYAGYFLFYKKRIWARNRICNSALFIVFSFLLNSL